MALATGPQGVQVFEGATIVSYGDPPPAGCGVLAWGQLLNIRTKEGKAVEVVVGCPEMHELPKVGSVCNVAYDIGPARVLLRWPDGRASSTTDPTPYPNLLLADGCTPD